MVYLPKPGGSEEHDHASRVTVLRGVPVLPKGGGDVARGAYPGGRRDRVGGGQHRRGGKEAAVPRLPHDQDRRRGPVPRAGSDGVRTRLQDVRHHGGTGGCAHGGDAAGGVGRTQPRAGSIVVSVRTEGTGKGRAACRKKTRPSPGASTRSFRRATSGGPGRSWTMRRQTTSYFLTTHPPVSSTPSRRPSPRPEGASPTSP